MKEPATDFMLRKARSFNEWLVIGEPRTDARIRECISRYPRADAAQAIKTACLKEEPVTCAHVTQPAEKDKGKPTLGPAIIRDIQTVVGFVLGNWPGYEDAVQWGDKVRKVDHSFYMAARRLKRGLLKNKTNGGAV
jgi:hypothetical protein